MKVVLFCGGLGMRLRESPANVPKPMVPIAEKPILWHLMSYYAHFGAREFVVCLGYRGDVIRSFLGESGEDWAVTFVDSGIDAGIGDRLLAAAPYVGEEAMFLANYADGLSDVPLPDQLAHFRGHGAVGGLLSVRPNLSYHTVACDPDGLVTHVERVARQPIRVNGGFFVFTPEVFRYLRAGEELVEEPFLRMIHDRALVAYEHDGFWIAIDTAKDKARADSLAATGNAPWMVWAHPPAAERP